LWWGISRMVSEIPRNKTSELRYQPLLLMFFFFFYFFRRHLPSLIPEILSYAAKTNLYFYDFKNIVANFGLTINLLRIYQISTFLHFWWGVAELYVDLGYSLIMLECPHLPYFFGKPWWVIVLGCGCGSAWRAEDLADSFSAFRVFSFLDKVCKSLEIWERRGLNISSMEFLVVWAGCDRLTKWT